MYQFVSESEYPEYEAFVADHPKGGFLQSAAWARFKTDTPRLVVSRDAAGKMRGAMSLFTQKAPLFSACTLYSPRGPVCDGNDAEAMRDLTEAARKVAREVNAYQFSIDPDITEEDQEFLQNLAQCGFQRGDNTVDNAILQPLSVFRIELEGKTEEELLASYHTKTRYSVRAALKSEARWRIGGRDDISVFQKLLEQTGARDGFHVRPVEYLYRMHDALGDGFVLFLVEVGSEAIAGSVLLRLGKKTWHLYGGSSEAHRETNPNYLLQWAMQTWSMQQGCTLYDMRGVAGEQDKTRPLEGLMLFKKRFGGTLVPLVGRLDLVLAPGKKRMIDAGRRWAHRLRK